MKRTKKWWIGVALAAAAAAYSFYNTSTDDSLSEDEYASSMRWNWLAVAATVVLLFFWNPKD